MSAVDVARDTIPSSLPESGEFATEQIELLPETADHTTRYVEHVLGELRSVVAGAGCPVHDCGPSLIVDLGSDDAGTVDIVAHNCCAKLDDVVSERLRRGPIFPASVIGAGRKAALGNGTPPRRPTLLASSPWGSARRASGCDLVA